MLTLPDYPWDTLTPYRERAAAPLMSNRTGRP